MMFVIEALVLSFLLAVNGTIVTNDPESRLVRMVEHNACLLYTSFANQQNFARGGITAARCTPPDEKCSPSAEHPVQP